MDIGQSFRNATDTFFAYLPNLLGFVVLLLVGFIVAKIVQAVVRKALQALHVDDHLKNGHGSGMVQRVVPNASVANGVSRVVFWIVFAFFAFSAIGALGIPAVTAFMNQVLAYLPNIVVAIAIFVVASIVAGAVAAGVGRIMGDTPTGKVVASVAPAIIMVIALFMVLNQLRIAEEIVTIAFAATMGALALGLALAFGLGGRDVARRLLEDAYAKGQDARQQIKQDAQTGRDRAQGMAQGTTQSSPSVPSQGSGQYDADYASTGSTTGYATGAGGTGVGSPTSTDPYRQG